MTPESTYNIDFERLASLVTHKEYRRPKYLGFVVALIRPIATAYASFLVWRSGCNYRLSHNGQVCYLQAALNDSFDPELRRIFIRNAVIQEPLWSYEPEDMKPIYTYEIEDDYPVYIRDESEFFGGGNDFTVWVPITLHPVESELQNLTTRMRGLIDYYKLYCKNYNILFY